MTITCPKCHKEISIPDDKPSAVKCPHCKVTLALKYKGDESSEEPEQDEKPSLKDRIKTVWREHKGKIIAGGAAVVAAVIGGIVVYNKIKDSTVDPDSDLDLLPPSEPDPPHTEIDRYELAVDPWATDDEDDEFPEDDGDIDMSDLEYFSFLVDHCYNCGGSLAGGEYTFPWEDGSNEYGYWICPHCHAINEDWNSVDDD